MYINKDNIENNHRGFTEDIEFTHAPMNQHPAIHTDALIECRVTGHPTPEVTWRYRGLSLNPHSTYLLLLREFQFRCPKSFSFLILFIYLLFLSLFFSPNPHI